MKFHITTLFEVVAQAKFGAISLEGKEGVTRLAKCINGNGNLYESDLKRVSDVLRKQYSYLMYAVNDSYPYKISYEKLKTLCDIYGHYIDVEPWSELDWLSYKRAWYERNSIDEDASSDWWEEHLLWEKRQDDLDPSEKANWWEY